MRASRRTHRLAAPGVRRRRRGDGTFEIGWYCEARALVLTLHARECSRGAQPCSPPCSPHGGFAVARSAFPGAEPPDPRRRLLLLAPIPCPPDPRRRLLLLAPIPCPPDPRRRLLLLAPIPEPHHGYNVVSG